MRGRGTERAEGRGETGQAGVCESPENKGEWMKARDARKSHRKGEGGQEAI